MTYEGTGVNRGDQVVAFKTGETPWTADEGWAKASSKSGLVCGEAVSGSASVACPSSGSVSFKIYEQGSFQVLLLKHLGFNEFGVDKGYSSSFTTLGTVSVTCAASGCVQMPPDCVDTQDFCGGYSSYCPDAQYTTIRTSGGSYTLAEVCRKTCNLCSSGSPSPPPPPPPPPPPSGCTDVDANFRRKFCQSYAAAYDCQSTRLSVNGVSRKLGEHCCASCSSSLIEKGSANEDDWEELKTIELPRH